MRRANVLWEGFVTRFEDALERYRKRRLTGEEAGELLGMSGRNFRRLAVRYEEDGVEGLQALAVSGEWVDVPPREGTVAVNFGGLLERWTGGRIKATQHRVLSPGRLRYSIPFFYEPRVDAVIEPLPLPGVETFAPFVYGDHLWQAMLKFPTYKGMDGLRKPRGIPAAA